MRFGSDPTVRNDSDIQYITDERPAALKRLFEVNREHSYGLIT